MDFRHLGRSGLKISEITYGNWLTHGSQVENDAATACVRAALDAGITTFDTADVYANTAAETVLGEALKGERRESLEIFTKVYWPTGPEGPQRHRAVAQAHHGVDRRVAHAGCRPTTSTSTRRTGTTTRRRSRRRCRRSPTSCGGQGALHRGQRVDRRRSSAPATRWPTELGIQLVSNQPQYSMLWRVIEAEVVPTCRELGISQIVWSPIAQGVLTGKYRPGAGAAGGVAGHRRQGRRRHDQALHERRRADPGAAAAADRRRARADHGAARRRLGAAERQRRGGDHRRLAAGAGARQRQGRRGESPRSC